MRWRRSPRLDCGYVAVPHNCGHRATRIAEQAEPGIPLMQMAVCRMHGRQKSRDGWTVWKAGHGELLELAAQLREQQERRREVRDDRRP